MEYKNISVLENTFLFEKCYGYEYHDQEDNCGYPFYPFEKENIIEKNGEIRSYIIDAKSIIWILENGIFHRPCCKACLAYILYHFGTEEYNQVLGLILRDNG